MPGSVIQGFFVAGKFTRPAQAGAAALPAAAVQRARGPGVVAPPRAGIAPRGPVQAKPMPGRPAPAHANSRAIQPFGASDSFAVDAVQLGLKPGGGTPLPPPLLAKMEAAFRADFSAVRVHTGPQASRIGAVAFTTGNDLYFAPGQYQPNSAQGQQLIGHELAHVIQQRKGRVPHPGQGVSVVQDRALEAEADRLGARAAAFSMPLQRKTGRAAPAAAQRKPGTHGAPVQRKVWINSVRAYDENEAIATLTYVRAGNIGGGNHFFPDKGVSEVVRDLAVGQSRKDAYANLMMLAPNLQQGAFAALNNPANNEVYDGFIDQFISFISSAPKNHFTCAGSGDNHGTTLDVPSTQSAKKNATIFAHRLLANIDAAYQHKGVVAGGAATGYIGQLRTYCNNNALD